MELTKKEIEGLMRLIGLTQENEIDCDQCLALIAEFAELNLAGRTIPDGLAIVEAHLAVCGECREEYELLQAALGQMDGNQSRR